MFNDKLENGVRLLIVDKMTKAYFIVVLAENYRNINRYTNVYIEYKNGVRREGIGSVHNENFDPDTNRADVYIITEEY